MGTPGQFSRSRVTSTRTSYERHVSAAAPDDRLTVAVTGASGRIDPALLRLAEGPS